MTIVGVFVSPPYATLTLQCISDDKSILRSPRKNNFEPDGDLRRRIVGYFLQVYEGARLADVERIVPTSMTRWGKVRIAGGGNKIRSKSAVSVAQSQSVRDASFVRVSVSSPQVCPTDYI